MRTRTQNARIRITAGALAGASLAAGVLAAGLGRSENPWGEVLARLQGARFHGAGGVRQQAANDCGPAALAHCLRRLGRAAPYPDPDGRLTPGPRGCTFAELAAEARRLGWPVRVRRIVPARLGDVALPAILWLRRGHFVVVEGRTPDGRWLGHDPALGRVSWTPEALERAWGGEILHGAPIGRSGTE